MNIAIVNDMPLATEALRRAVTLLPGAKVAWTARNGAEAVEACARQTPDLILMDLVMPVMDGVEATRRIMANTPCAILVVTVSVGTNLNRVYEALGQGALDAVDTPPLGGGDLRTAAAPLLAKIRLVYGMVGGGSRAPFAVSSGPIRSALGAPLVAIGASAGGPAAVAAVLRDLPRSFSASVVVVQHIDKQFAQGMAEWLNQSSALPVRLALEGERPAPGAAWLAGTNDHLVLRESGCFAYAAEPRGYVYRPSVDVFFDSVMRFWRGPVIGVILTGMGRDGALGLKTLRNRGHHTIAQDAASCAVFGMPKAAIALDAAVEVLPLASIGARIGQLLP
ncbi:MAG TPA: chemotaxis-specific protein-glutamate methyltransferase CheB [Opitutaceae bacterium]